MLIKRGEGKILKIVEESEVKISSKKIKDVLKKSKKEIKRQSIENKI